jgi:hypothetical protein
MSGLGHAVSGPSSQVRTLVDLDQPIAIGRGAARAVLRAELALRRLPTELAVSVTRFNQLGGVGHFRPGIPLLSLRHRLSHAIPADPRLAEAEDTRSFDERSVLAHLHPALLGATVGADHAGVVYCLEAACAGLTGGRGRLRSGAMQVRNPHADVAILLPDAEVARGQLRVIAGLMVRPRSASPIVHGAQLMVGVLNAHAFSDGNGRLSRVLFNHVLRQAGAPNGGYLPIYSAMLRSQGGFELALREAEIMGRWDALARYLAEALLIAARPVEECFFHG